VTILQIDGDGEATIVHVAVSVVSLPCQSEAANIGHLPFTIAAVQASVTSLENAQVPLPDYREGYEIWRAAHESGSAGVFNVPIAEAVAGIVSASCQ
jgi:hypothetical protein